MIIRLLLQVKPCSRSMLLRLPLFISVAVATSRVDVLVDMTSSPWQRWLAALAAAATVTSAHVELAVIFATLGVLLLACSCAVCCLLVDGIYYCVLWAITQVHNGVCAVLRFLM